MKFVIMAAGANKNWNDYLGIPKHMVEVGGEPLIGRTARLLKENGIDDYIITCNNNCYAQFGQTFEPTRYDCEIDRFEETFLKEPVCFLYGDVFYTPEAIYTIVNTPTKDILFFGSEGEMFAIKIKNCKHFKKAKAYIKKLYLEGKINRCICWEIYRYLHDLSLNEHIITDDYIKILDGTDDIDFPWDYENFKERMSKLL